MGHHILKSAPESPFIYKVPTYIMYHTILDCILLCESFSGTGTHQMLMEVVFKRCWTHNCDLKKKFILCTSSRMLNMKIKF